jgi:predicted ATPase/DNA-binding XRE family transcriptional regulator/Tfp pilus assembly protein PilF
MKTGEMAETKSFGEWLRHRRRELDLTQGELARQVGCARITLRKIEADQARPSKQLADLLMEQLRVPADERESLMHFARGGEPAKSITTTTPPDNLPHPISSFIGREREIGEVKNMMKLSRLVTLTGAGGCGKTRLAIEAARQITDLFSDGAWFVAFAPVSDSTLVYQTIASALKVREDPGRPLIDTLCAYLHSKHLLLVFDNCEHLVGECAEAADALLQACPPLRILATSREALGIGGEVTFPVRSLSLPAATAVSMAEAASSEAVRLFVERAAAIQPGFSINDQNSASIQRICSRLDGIPLALERAAALVKGLSPEQIASRLDDRFQLLTDGSRTALPRQRTLQATIDWSYKLLSEDERLLFQRLSVFAGEWNLEAAEAICSGERLPSKLVLDSELRLVDKSLVVSDTQASQPRHHMLETIRQFAQERLGESGEAEAVRRQHSAYFTTWVEQMGMELRAGPTQLDRFEQLEVEQANIGAALEWSLGGGDSELGLRLVGAIFYFWWRAGHWLEWERWTALAATKIEGDPGAARAAALVALCGVNLYVKRNMDTARRYGEEAVALYRRLSDQRSLAWAIFWLNTCSIGLMENADEYARAIALTEEALELLRQAGDVADVGQGLNNLGQYAIAHGDHVRAKAAFQESLEIARAIGDQIREQIEYSNLGSLALADGDYETAMTLFTRTLVWARERGNSPNILSGLANLTSFWQVRGQPERAARLIGAGEALSKNLGVRLQLDDQGAYDRYVTRVRTQLSDEKFKALQAEGQAMDMEQAIEYALAERPI